MLFNRQINLKLLKINRIASMDTVKYTLSESQMPVAWHNTSAELPTPVPLLFNPVTSQPIGAADLAPLSTKELIKQEANSDCSTRT